jgi:hypothetical protein
MVVKERICNDEEMSVVGSDATYNSPDIVTEN